MPALLLRFMFEEIGNSKSINLYGLRGASTLLFSLDSKAFKIFSCLIALLLLITVIIVFFLLNYVIFIFIYIKWCPTSGMLRRIGDSIHYKTTRMGENWPRFGNSGTAATHTHLGLFLALLLDQPWADFWDCLGTIVFIHETGLVILSWQVKEHTR